MMALKLTAQMNGADVEVTGPKAKVSLGHKAPARKFDFHLKDETNLNVRFSSLAVQESDTCPSAGSGIASDQIVDVEIDGDKASFTDLNSGRARTLSYVWFFECDDPRQRPEFDPVIQNGGGN